MTIRVELYGRLRDAGDAVELDWAGGTAAQLLDAVAGKLGGGSLRGAVLATEGEILNADAQVPAGARLAVLPPVCGG